MRTLKFIVNKQEIVADPGCDFTGLIPGTEGYLKAEFSFSKEWDGCIKVAGFHDGVMEHAVQLKDNKSCMIPPEVTKRYGFKVRVLGARGDDYKITTGTEIVVQDGR